MENHIVSTAQELRELLAKFGTDFLFRGQVQHYGSKTAPAMSTSFSRNGCIPPLMLRWSHYAGFTLAALLGKHHREVTLEFTQAILQHYGWRSFYLDGSSEPAVSAWFAAHIFSRQRSIELCEDCYEDPVFLLKSMASYGFEEGTGYLYVLSKESIRKSGLDLTDLSAIEIDDCRPRFHAQSAWLIGPLHGDLPPGCIVAMIEGPRSVFREYASGKGFRGTSHLFPDTDEDPVLEFFTSMPWKQRALPNEAASDLKFYAQPFEFPEYHDSFRKHNPPYVAFYDGRPSLALRIAPKVVAFDVPEIVVYGYADPVASKFPRVAEIIQGEGHHFVFEIDSLVRRPGPLSSEYVKGFAVSKGESDLFSVADLVVEHPGRQMAGCGINKGWHYRISDNGTWVREISADDCPCGNNSIHEHHLSMLTILDDILDSDPSTVMRRRMPAINVNK